MLNLGNWNELTIVRFTDHGAYLDGGELGEILMPKAYVRREMKPGTVVRVFVYLDQSERLVGTTETPLATVGQFACLRVAWVNQYGAFLHWGVMKDLFVPFSEQRAKMEQGRAYVVYVHIDEATRRIVGSAKTDRWLTPAPRHDYFRGKEVDLLVSGRSPLGLKVIVDNAHAGLIYADQIFGPEPHLGDRLKGTVVTVRPDGKLDISLGSIGKSRFRDFADVLLEALQAAGGSLPYSDNSSPEEIADRFGVSKKTFKRALGTLYRAGRVSLQEHETKLVKGG